MRKPALFSVHDVMPSTLDATERIVDSLSCAGINKVTLLVVPGCDWGDATLHRLERLAAQGNHLAGHGWAHRISEIRNARHWLHSMTISRQAAEHLALERESAVALMQRCFDWFAETGLPTPSLYVPPAWAMGEPRRDDLDELPFQLYETLGGVYDSATRQFLRSPMIGFEADTWWRSVACRLWNRLNLRFGRGPLRFSIHPADPELLLGRELAALIAEPWDARYYTEIEEFRP